MSIATVIKLPRVFGGGTVRSMPQYEFDDGERTELKPEMNTEVIARRIEKANANLMVSLEVLREAENHVVICQGDVEKDKLILEREQDALRNAIEARNLL